jgi:phosphopantothenoylcysteine decarboxylase
MANVLLGVTGSVAAIKTPELFERLTHAGHTVRIVATNAALYFFDPAAFEPLTEPDGQQQRNPEKVTLDEDEWPGIDEGRRWQVNEPVLHIELRRWADLLLIAPLDANTLAKFANGLTDNCLSCVWRAWDPARPVVLAPAMNTFMWEHPVTVRHLRQLALDAGAPEFPGGLGLGAVIEAINQSCPRLRIVPTQIKMLACHDVGDGAMAALTDVVTAVGALFGDNPVPV